VRWTRCRRSAVGGRLGRISCVLPIASGQVERHQPTVEELARQGCFEPRTLILPHGGDPEGGEQVELRIEWETPDFEEIECGPEVTMYIARTEA
jgi:coenzyme PQQ precursor peptide PqqA